jgi:hypothetical protein
MSARKSDSGTASLSPINRESELRSDATQLAQLWKSAQIIHLVDARLSAGDDGLTFVDAAAVTALEASFVTGDRFFLGIGRDERGSIHQKMMEPKSLKNASMKALEPYVKSVAISMPMI